MRILASLVFLASLTACSFSSDSGNNNQYTCSDRDQKRLVRDVMQDWYLWNDLLPDKIKLGDYDSPAELLASLTQVQPLDNYSRIGSAAADAAFYGGGLFQGFGFGWELVAADDVRLTRVFSSSPAAAIAEIEAAQGISAALDQGVIEFTMREIDGVTEFSVTVSQDIVTIDPVPQWRLIPTAGGPPVGYLELSSFISTANSALDDVFAEFLANGVTDVIIDLRYNGGGIVSTAELLGDLLGGDVAENLTFTRTLFNADRSAEYDSEQIFARLTNSINLSRLVVIATDRTASASELLTNAMEPHVDVTIVGDTTFGKPVGQAGFEFCGAILRLTAFRTVNANDIGDYYSGLPADCAVSDDLDIPVGDAADPNMIAALGYLDTGACPASPASTVQAKPATLDDRADDPWQGPPWREVAGAY
jgi:hypothetical protein